MNAFSGMFSNGNVQKSEWYVASDASSFLTSQHSGFKKEIMDAYQNIVPELCNVNAKITTSTDVQIWDHGSDILSVSSPTTSLL